MKDLEILKKTIHPMTTSEYLYGVLRWRVRPHLFWGSCVLSLIHGSPVGGRWHCLWSCLLSWGYIYAVASHLSGEFEMPEDEFKDLEPTPRYAKWLQAHQLVCWKRRGYVPRWDSFVSEYQSLRKKR